MDNKTFIAGKVINIVNLTEDVRLIKFELSKEMHFQSGQYIEIQIPGIDQPKPYSIASSSEDALHIETIIKIAKGATTSQYFGNTIKIGDVVNIYGPYGNFYLHQNGPKKKMLIAGGTGLAPIRSIMLNLEKQGFKEQTDLYFGVRSKTDLIFDDVFEKLSKENNNFKYYPTLSEIEKDKGYHVGFVTDTVNKHNTDLSDFDIYMCGPKAMIDACLTLLLDKRANPEHIYYDKF